MRKLIVNKTVAIYLILVGCLLIGCDKNEDTNMPDDLIVLSGYLYEGEAVNDIKLSKPLLFESADTIYENIPDAEVTLVWQEKEYHLEHVEDGSYYCPSESLAVIEGDEYNIVVNYEGKTVSAQTVVPFQPTGLMLSKDVIYVDENMNPKEQINNEDANLEVTWDNPEGDYFYVVVENIEENPESIDFPLPEGFNFSFRSSPSAGDIHTIKLLGEVQQYGKHVVKVYRVNAEYANLYENRDQDSRTLAEPYTNVENGLGIFTAFSFVADTIEVRKK